MAEETTTVLENEEANKWEQMDAGQRDEYVAGLHEKLAAEKKDEAPPKEPDATDQGSDADSEAAEEEAKTISVNADEDSGNDDAAKAENKVEGEEVKDDWRDAGVKDLAVAYGLDDESLAAIPSREVLDVVLKGIDKKAFAEQNADEGLGDNAQQSQQQPDDHLADLTKFKLPDTIDEEAAGPLNSFIDATVAEIRALRADVHSFKQAQAEQRFQALRNEALHNLQKIGHTDLYGEPGKPLTKEQQANVDAVLDDHFDRGSSLARRGGKPSPTQEFLKRSVFAVHGEHIVKKTKQEHLAKLKSQSHRRTGGGSTKFPTPASGATPLERAIGNLPALRQKMELGEE
jgi:hypothetical protein